MTIPLKNKNVSMNVVFVKDAFLLLLLEEEEIFIRNGGEQGSQENAPTCKEK